MRAPDFAFIKSARIPRGGLPKGFFPGAPDLAIEILSPNDRATEVEDKVNQWLTTGAVPVWTIDFKRRAIAINMAGAQPKVFMESDSVDGGELLPGFRARVQDLLPPRGAL